MRNMFQKQKAKPQNIIAIGTPSFGKQVFTPYMFSVINALSKSQHPMIMLDSPCDSLVQRGRNIIAHQFMNHPLKPTHLMFIDADISFDSDAINKLVACDKDIIAATYPIKEFESARIKKALEKGCDPEYALLYGTRAVCRPRGSTMIELKDLDTPIPMDFLGTGFMLIKRCVFEKMRAEHPERIYKQMGITGDIMAYFDCGFDVIDPTKPEMGQQYLSEDYFFCKQANALGFDVFLHPGIRLGHIGTHIFQGDIVTGNGVIYDQHKVKATDESNEG